MSITTQLEKIIFALQIMHTKTIHSYLLRFLLISISFVCLLLVAASPKASAASDCSLELSVASDKTSAQVGETITRTFTLKNVAGSVCKDAAYSIYYSPNESVVSTTPRPRASNYYWYVGMLTPHEAFSSTIVTKVVNSTDSQVITEGCGSANGAEDSCTTSTVTIPTTSGTPVVSAPQVPQTGTPTPAPVSPVVTPTPVTTQTYPVATTTIKTATSTPVMSKPSGSSSKENGIWVWNFPSQMDTSAGNSQLQQLAGYGFTSIYMTIDDYLDIASLPEGAQKNTAKAAYFAHIAHVVTKAQSLGIAVDAEGGWRDWAYPTNTWKGFALIDAVKEYNAAYPNAKLRGFQYDVEPYLLPEYETNKAKVLAQYVAFIDQSVTRLVGSNITFSMSIPHFYDDAQAWTPSFAYNGKTTFAFNHLLNILEKKPGSSILLMSYRNFFDGANGTRQISETEIKEASAGYSTNIIVGQETGNVDPAMVTYYGSSKAEVLNAVTEIKSGFGSYSRFGGTAVHYMDSFLQMK